MRYTMKPSQVKRREYMGLAGVSLGLITGITGVVSLLFLLPLGLSLITFGSALFASGLLVLMNIPDLIAHADETW